MPLLLVIGATDLTAALARLGKVLGRRVVAVDPRPDYATIRRIPDADEVVCAWPEPWLEEHPLTPRDAALVVTHDARIDDSALRALLPGRAGHVAVLGSRTTHAERLERLAGVAGIERLVGPAGLDLGGTTAAEVAMSMLAEVVAVSNGRDGSRLRATPATRSSQSAPGLAVGGQARSLTGDVQPAFDQCGFVRGG